MASLRLHSKQLWLLQFVAVVALFVGLQLTQPLRFNTDIGQLFPSKFSQPEIQYIFKQISQLNENHNLILVEAPALVQAKESALQLAEQLSQLKGVEQAQARFPEQLSMEAVVAFLAPYRHLLLSNDYRQALQQQSGEALYRLIFSELNQFANPLVASSIELDPTLSLANYLTTRENHSRLKQDGPFFYAKDAQSYYVMVHFQTLSSGLSLEDNAALVQQLQMIETSLEVPLVKLGALFFADYAASNAKWEMTLFSTLALMGMSVLVLLAYRSVMALGVTLAVTGLSLFYGYTCLNLLFEQVHILTFVFSITLVGVSCDYCFHALTQLKTKPTLASIRLPLIMGFVSTAIGYLILIFSPVEVFLQIGLFTISGLAISAFTVLALFPSLPSPKQHQAIGNSNPLYRLQLWYCKPKATVGLLLILLVGLGWLTLNLQLNDDVRTFYHVSENLKADELKVKALLGNQAENQFIIIKGSNDEAVLQQELATRQTLDKLKQQGVIQGYNALTQWLPTVTQQEQNRQLLKQAISAGWLDPLAELLGHSNWQLNSDASPLTVAQWLSTPLGQQHKTLWVEHQGSYFSLIKLIGIADLPRLTEQLATHPEILLVDRATEISDQLSKFRNQLLLFLAASFVILLLLLSRVYDLKRACAVVGVTLSAVLLALIATLLLKQQLNIFNIMSVVIIIALGLDYAIFYADQGLSAKVSYTTLISALSSILVFAVLVLSQTPAIHNFGLTVFLGILAAYLLAPLVALIRVHPNSG